jgi:hypothetical protein
VLAAADVAGVVVLPPAWFYPVPNSEAAAPAPAAAAAAHNDDNGTEGRGDGRGARRAGSEAAPGDAAVEEAEAAGIRHAALQATWCAAESMAVHHWDRSWVPPSG